jgi:hypothetical protein
MAACEPLVDSILRVKTVNRTPADCVKSYQINSDGSLRSYFAQRLMGGARETLMCASTPFGHEKTTRRWLV